MARRVGTADLPLHGGHVPRWLSDRMTRLGAVISEAIVHHYGRDELLRRLAHPFWFQSFGAVMGMDWRSSGITTSVIGSLKRGLAPLESELGIHVCGGRGKYSRQTPHELVRIGERVGLDGGALAKASRLIAKVDSATAQDGFDLYLHGFIVTDGGQWAVVQEAMSGERRQARRYHWLSEGLKSFVEEPHAAIDGLGQGEIINLTDRRAAASRRMQLHVLQSLGPDGIALQVRDMEAWDQDPVQSPRTEQPLLPHLTMPAHHEVCPSSLSDWSLANRRTERRFCGARGVGGGSVRAGGRWRRYLRACNTLRLTHWGVTSPYRALRANLRFTFQAMVTRLHSPRTLSSPRSRNCRKPRTDL